MRDSTYSVLEALSKGPKTWSELVRATKLTEPGLLKVLKEMQAKHIVAEVLGTSPAGARTKKYALSKKAITLRVYATAKLLKKKLELL